VDLVDLLERVDQLDHLEQLVNQAREEQTVLVDALDLAVNIYLNILLYITYIYIY
jgi:hypothetical protein